MPTRKYTYYDYTISLCPECLKRIDAKIVFEDKTLKDITKNYVSVIAKDGITFEEATYKIIFNLQTVISFTNGSVIHISFCMN